MDRNENVSKYSNDNLRCTEQWRRANSKRSKRKHEGPYDCPPSKKPNSWQSAKDLHNLEGARYSANDRLKHIRQQSSQSREREPKSVADTSSSFIAPDNRQANLRETDSLQYKRSYRGTGKPSTLQERLKQFKVAHDHQTGPKSLDTISNASDNPIRSKSHLTTNEQLVISERVSAPFALEETNQSVTSRLSVSEKDSFNQYNYTSVASNERVLNSPCSEEEPMDWTPIEEKQLIYDLQNLRRTVNTSSANPQSTFQEFVADKAHEIVHNKSLLKTNYIVVDTNIFLSHVNTVKQLMVLKMNGVVSPTILVPWIVIQELDYIKDKRSSSKSDLIPKARRAISFINDCLMGSENLKAQSIRDAAQQDFVSKNFDDGILHCCMQILDRRNQVMLLSNDINLRNKALSTDIEAYSHSQIMRRLDPFGVMEALPDTDIHSSKKIENMELRLGHLCSSIIMRKLKEQYGSLWNILGGIKGNPPPWKFLTCLELFNRFWSSVFFMDLHNMCIKDIRDFQAKHETSIGDPKKLMEFGLNLCMHLQRAYSEHAEDIKDCKIELQRIFDSA